MSPQRLNIPTALRRRGVVPVVAGIALLLLALLMLWINEHQAQRWDRAMARHGDKLLDGGADARPGSGQFGHMLRVTGVPHVVVAPRDAQFNVQADAPQLLRTVEMFQWREIRIGDHVHYEQDWVDHAVDATRFAQPRGHANPGPFPFHSETLLAPGVRLAGYTLAPAIVRAMPMPTHAVPVKLAQIPPNLAASLREDASGLTTSTRHGAQLGDLRIRWRAADLDPITVIAQVDGERLEPAADAAPGQGFQAQLGERSLRDVLSDLPQRPHAPWAWRALTFLIALAGVVLLLRAWRRPPVDMLAALGLAVAALAGLSGLLWIGVSARLGIAALVVAVLALAGAAWRLRLQRLRPAPAGRGINRR